jgi:hypothetical protein
MFPSQEFTAKAAKDKGIKVLFAFFFAAYGMMTF